MRTRYIRTPSILTTMGKPALSRQNGLRKSTGIELSVGDSHDKRLFYSLGLSYFTVQNSYGDGHCSTIGPISATRSTCPSALHFLPTIAFAFQPRLEEAGHIFLKKSRWIANTENQLRMINKTSMDLNVWEIFLMPALDTHSAKKFVPLNWNYFWRSSMFLITSRYWITSSMVRASMKSNPSALHDIRVETAIIASVLKNTSKKVKVPLIFFR